MESCAIVLDWVLNVEHAAVIGVAVRFTCCRVTILFILHEIKP